MADYPIIYLRGYAGNQSGVEATVDDPFYGFNVGSTHTRVDAEGKSIFFAFESPLVRLMTDHGYQDVFWEGREPARDWTSEDPALGARSIWIFRYYDVTSETFDVPGERVRLEIEEAARRLRDRISEVKEITGAPKVILVGHSTGGLIARCLIQKIFREAKDSEMPATEHIDKVYTYATPHGGIEFDVFGGDILERARDFWGRNNMDDFGPRRMREYLRPKWREDAEFKVLSLDGAFPPERFFCLVGTNARDYTVAMGASRTIVGPQSDGLVLIRNAALEGSPRAFVHRAHSGRYGIVNSEEGYQNLERFLFGNMRVDVALRGANRLIESADESRSYQAEVQLSIRGLPVLMHDQTIEHNAPVVIERAMSGAGDDIGLFTAFLMSSRAPGDTCRYALQLGVHELRRKHRFLDLRDHLEQVPLWKDYMIVDLESLGGADYRGSYFWLAEDGPQIDDREGRPLEWSPEGDVKEVSVPLPEQAQRVLGDGARIVMRASPWS